VLYSEGMQQRLLRRIAGGARCLAVPALVSLVSLVSGCSSDSEPPPPGTDTAIWPANATQMVIKNEGGGFVGPAPSGSECQAGEASFTFTVATRNLAWEKCQTSASNPYTHITGERTLNKAQVDGGLDAALQGVALSTKTSCGADKSSLLLTVTTPTGEHEYLDDFYACNKAGTYVSGLDQLLQAASDLTPSL